MPSDPSTPLTSSPLSIEARKRGQQADAALEQLFGYYSRDDRPRAVITELDARTAA